MEDCSDRFSSLLEVCSLKKYYPLRSGIFRRKVAEVRAVDNITLAIRKGETLGLVGESGCGKTTAGRAILFLDKPTDGIIRFQGKDLSRLNKRELRDIRKDLQMIFQDPFESLNPRQTISEILEEPFAIHRIDSSSKRRQAARTLLDRVGMPESSLHRFPFEFSGGQRQRIGIARAIALDPKLIICDEPVSALDVSIQSQILNLLLDLQQDLGLSYLFITHNLAVVKHVSDRIAVMYAGKIVETAGAEDLYRRPVHPYTRALIAAIPIPSPRSGRKSPAVTGETPSVVRPPAGCRFHPRCPFQIERCRLESPELRPVGDINHQSACHRAEEI